MRVSRRGHSATMTAGFACVITLVAFKAAADQGIPEATPPVVDDAPDSNQPPVAVSILYPPQGQAPLRVTLDGSASADLDGDIIMYRWDLGDGSPPVSGPSLDHDYLAPGAYLVTLTVTDHEGLTHQDRQTLVVVEAQPVPTTGAVPSAPPMAAEDIPQETSLVVSVADLAGEPLDGADLTIQWPQGMQTAQASQGVALFATGDQTLPPDWLVG